MEGEKGEGFISLNINLKHCKGIQYYVINWVECELER